MKTVLLVVCVVFKGSFNIEVWVLGKRKCEVCGADLTDEDVIKIILEDGSCEVFPLSTCPNCFKNELLKKAQRSKQS